MVAEPIPPVFEHTHEGVVTAPQCSGDYIGVINEGTNPLEVGSYHHPMNCFLAPYKGKRVKVTIRIEVQAVGVGTFAAVHLSG